MEEAALIRRAQEGDLAAFETLVAAHKDYVFNIAYSMTGNYHDANDMAQEAFIKAFRAIKKFNVKSNFSTWMYRITMNACLDELRRQKRKAANNVSIDAEDDEHSRMDLASSLPTPEQAYEKSEVRRAVTAAIQKLPDKHKRMIILRDINGFSYDQIARLEQCSVGTVKSRISRARQHLKEILVKNKELF